ncbi:thiamine-phosphate kinase [Shewanella cyperi]|uniref:Thiamine-monophosphate kinase n=1 Tax=Shewanella cyperi TaxID=2814292 RepID=A0A974XPB0_9GAMM|nr:thiamine-phosphate kinase [Shewanella cyperi]QSX30943.1 thiamine-phosphate kinase [Shewanella cyperi]
MKEFQLIDQFFNGRGPLRRDVVHGIGDDCALVQPSEGKQLAISCDTLVEGVHFFADMPARALGYKALAVNLSDLAAMGAEPAWMTLALSLPQAEEAWLSEFSTGLFEAADYYGIALIGGDTTASPVKMFSITVHGQVPAGKALTRYGAHVGDWVYVTGTLGDSALGLDLLRGVEQTRPEHREYLIERHYRPVPRVLAGQSLRGLASSAIDLSDGLVSDLGHILKASGVGANIEVENLPLSQALKDSVSLDRALAYALTGGEDYELLFTVPEAQRGALEIALSHAGVKFVRIGQINAGNRLKLQLNGEPFTPEFKGFEHF